jgi:hypothetical protein
MEKWANELTNTFSENIVQMTKAHEEMLIMPGHIGNANKNHVNIPLTPVRMAIMKIIYNCWEGCGEKGTLTH